MAILFPDKLKSNNPAAYGIVDAMEVSGHKSVGTLDELYGLKDCILSRSGDNTDNDALGQVWHVGGTVNADYRLVSWESKDTAAGWEKVISGNDIGDATAQKSGLMSSKDKAKLDGMEALEEMTEAELDEILNNNTVEGFVPDGPSFGGDAG